MCHSAAYSCSDGAAHRLAAVRRHTSPASVHRNAVYSTNSSVKCANAAAAAYALRAAHSRCAQHAVRRGALYDHLDRRSQLLGRRLQCHPQHQSQVCLSVSQTFGNSRCATDTVAGAGGSARADRRRDGWVSEDRLCDLVRRACRNSVEPEANGTLFNCEWIGRHGLAWPGLARTHAHDPISTQAQAHTHAHAGQRCWSQCRWGVRPGSYAQTCEAFGLPGGHECDPTQRWHQTKVPKSWTNWTSHCRVFRAKLGVHRHVQGRARLGGGRSPRSEPGATRTATRAADRSSCRRRSRQCERQCLPLLGAAAAAPAGRSYHAGLCQPPESIDRPLLA